MTSVPINFICYNLPPDNVKYRFVSYSNTDTCLLLEFGASPKRVSFTSKQAKLTELLLVRRDNRPTRQSRPLPSLGRQSTFRLGVWVCLLVILPKLPPFLTASFPELRLEISQSLPRCISVWPWCRIGSACFTLVGLQIALPFECLGATGTLERSQLAVDIVLMSLQVSLGA